MLTILRTENFKDILSTWAKVKPFFPPFYFIYNESKSSGCGKTWPFQYSKTEFCCNVKEVEGLVRERGDRATQLLGTGMPFPSYPLKLFTKNDEWEPFCYWRWATVA